MLLRGSIILLAFAFICVQGDVVFRQTNVDNVFSKSSISKSRECTEQGVMCDDCNTLVYCLKNEDGEWLKELAQKCENGRTCSTQLTPHACSSTVTDDCDPRLLNYTLECNQPGMFPHPFDCTRYFQCHTDLSGDIVKKPISHQCRSGFGYDSLTTLCRKPLEDGECEGRLMDRCYTAGRIDSVPGNPYLYTVCLTTDVEGTHKFFPQFFYCKENEVFVGETCVKIQSGVNSEGRCTGIGFFYDPTDCKKYRQCMLSGAVPLPMSCLFGYEFNPIEKTCVSFKC